MSSFEQVCFVHFILCMNVNYFVKLCVYMYRELVTVRQEIVVTKGLLAVLLRLFGTGVFDISVMSQLLSF